LTAAIRDYGTAEEVALAAGCSVATAKRYRRGETMPNPIGLARLMNRSKAIADAMLRLAGLDDLSMDLEEARLKRELARLQAIRAESKNGPARRDAGTEETSGAPSGAAARPMVARRD
jgi:hypothetical protein